MSDPVEENLNVINTPTCLDMLDDFYLFLKTNNYSPATIYHYQNDLAIFDNFLKSRNLKIKNLDKRSIFEFKAYLSSNDRQTATTHLEMARTLSSSSISSQSLYQIFN